MTRVIEGPPPESEPIILRLNFFRNLRTEILGQRAVETIGDVCFGCFVFTVLILTAIAITYKPPDPWLQGQKPYNILFNSMGNSSFHPDDSVLLTGENLVTSPPSSLPFPLPINASQLPVLCNTSLAWNCSDLGLQQAVDAMNAHHFPELLFYSYRFFPGGSEGECDVAWKYRPRNISTPRMYIDYRRVGVIRNEDCSFEVKRIGKWHSGVHAKQEAETEDYNNMDSGQGKYLYYSRGNEYCKSMGQWMWGFLCALGEAQYLHRTFVLDLNLCLASEYSSSHHDEPGKDFRFYFDLEHLANVTSIIEKTPFEEQWSDLPVRRHVVQSGIEPVDLKNDTHAVLYRVFANEGDAGNSWSSVCDGQAGNYIHRPWSFLWKSKTLMNIVDAICNKLEWDFDVVHVIRGYKAENKRLWPHLDADTSPESLIAKLKTMIGYRRKVWIASNEPYSHYFDRLREPFEVHVLQDFSYLWAENTEWWNATRKLAPGRNVTFDGYMKMIVDTEMLYRGKKRVETFNDLTKDCKNGVGRC